LDKFRIDIWGAHVLHKEEYLGGCIIKLDELTKDKKMTMVSQK